MSKEELQKRYQKAQEVDGIASEVLQKAFLFRVGDITADQLKEFIKELPDRFDKLFDHTYIEYTSPYFDEAKKRRMEPLDNFGDSLDLATHGGKGMEPIP